MADGGSPGGRSPEDRIAELEAKVQALEQFKAEANAGLAQLLASIADTSSMVRAMTRALEPVMKAATRRPPGR